MPARNTISVETAIRLIVIGQELLIAAVFLLSNSGRAARYSGAMLMLSVVGYLVSSDDMLRNSHPLVGPIALLFSLVVPYCLWLFARALFEFAWPRAWLIVACVAVVAIDWLTFRGGYTVATAWTAGLSTLMHVLSLAIVAHALWIALSGRSDDLIERRRAFRLIFVVVVSLQVASVLILELVLANVPPPAWLQLVNVVAIAAITMGLALPLLEINAELFAVALKTDAGQLAVENDIHAVAINIEHRQLLDLMAAGYYCETGLTIRVLAEKLKQPEHRLRRLINGKMACRNFSAFLNGYRIAEAQKRLTDPTKVRIPVLTIALDLGYASLGPFNRAFKLITGTTPSDYRRRNMRSVDSDSE